MRGWGKGRGRVSVGSVGRDKTDCSTWVITPDILSRPASSDKAHPWPYLKPTSPISMPYAKPIICPPGTGLCLNAFSHLHTSLYYIHSPPFTLYHYTSLYSVYIFSSLHFIPLYFSIAYIHSPSFTVYLYTSL